MWGSRRGRRKGEVGGGGEEVSVHSVVVVVLQ